MTTKHEPNGRWFTRFRINGVPFAQRFDRQQDGIDWENTTKADHLRGTYVDPRGGRMLFQDYFEQWMANAVHLGANTVKNYRSGYKNHIKPFFGRRQLGAIKKSDVQGWIRSLDGKASPTVINNRLYVLFATVMNAAVDDELIGSSPCRKINLPPYKEHEVIIPTLEEVEALELAFHPKWRAAVWLAAGGSTRKGEAGGLTLDKIDFDNKTITICRQLQVIDNQRVLIPPKGFPKSMAGFRTVPIGTRTLEALQEHVDTFPTTSALDDDGNTIEGLIFSNRNGDPAIPQTWARQWDAAVKRAGLNPKLRLHDLRHFFASMLLRAGISETVVAKRMGHANTDMMKIYGHEWGDDAERTRAAIELMLPPRLRLVS